MSKTAQLIPTPEGLTLDGVMQHFNTDEKARAYLECIRWPHGPYCPHCQNYDKANIWEIETNKETKVRSGLRECGACGKQFSVTVGTIFHGSKIPLRKWLIAWYLLCSSKKGISALQIQRMLGIGSYRTAWMMMHKIRYALKDPAFSGKLSGTVEIDECYVGGAAKNMHRSVHRRKITGSGFVDKIPVVSLVERGGRVRSVMMRDVTAKKIKAVMNAHVEKSAVINTDESRPYVLASREYAGHRVVHHGLGEYSRGDATTNSVEGYFSLIKRGVIGTFHHVSEKHLPLYLSEFDFRYNQREETDGTRTFEAIKHAEGKRMTYKPLVGNAA